jgi:hypothetical protein
MCVALSWAGLADLAAGVAVGWLVLTGLAVWLLLRRHDR